MIQEPKLLTEAELKRQLADHVSGKLATADLVYGWYQRGLIAEEPVEPLLIEARKIATDCCAHLGLDYVGHPDDDAPVVQAALRALRRGKEIGEAAARTLTREEVREACHIAHKGWIYPDAFVTRLHAALQERQQ